MSIEPLQMDHAAVKQPVQAPQGSRGVVRERDPGTGEAVPSDQVLLAASPDTRFSRKQIQDDQKHELAGAVRQTDRALKLLGQKIDQMKAPLEAIVKNFPPFSPQDKARMKLLREYSSIRKEIDQLTFPPPPEIAQARETLSVPPPLAADANDSQIADHIAKLDAAAADLSRQRTGLASDTASFLQDQRFFRSFSAPGGAESAGTVEKWSESAAVQKSAEVGQQFANSVRQGVTVDHSKFLKGMS